VCFFVWELTRSVSSGGWVLMHCRVVGEPNMERCFTKGRIGVSRRERKRGNGGVGVAECSRIKLGFLILTLSVSDQERLNATVSSMGFCIETPLFIDVQNCIFFQLMGKLFYGKSITSKVNIFGQEIVARLCRMWGTVLFSLFVLYF